MRQYCCSEHVLTTRSAKSKSQNRKAKKKAKQRKEKKRSQTGAPITGRTSSVKLSDALALLPLPIATVALAPFLVSGSKSLNLSVPPFPTKHELGTPLRVLSLRREGKERRRTAYPAPFSSTEERALRRR